MRKPNYLERLKAEMSAARKPGDPVPFADIPEQRYDVRMPAREPGIIITHVPEADEWCRDQCQSPWGRAIDRGRTRDEQVPVYRFTDQDEAFWFKVRFG